ncbi:MAG: effector-associated domain EAD1-containing protein [Scytonema sp. PMC 1069.18]|nr:effector-associated domain EAD1-containing protein [Scytonema sp. PMC 1069.18]MEC4885121.1 effector-associated domain EAD1-containing protein [Scytonema sp. PMC 1070.18]
MIREQLLLSEPSSFHPHWLDIIGRKLYQVLGQNIQQVIETALAKAKSDRTWLHIRFRFPADDPKYVRLTDYPWELLCNEYGFLARQGVTFSRYIAYGVAQNLIGRGIPAVVAMTYTISVPAARDFTESFYHSLGQKNSLAIAVSSGKSAIGIEGKEWYRPVLYLRWEDNDGGQLFKDSVAPSNYPIQTSPSFPITPTNNQPLYQVMTLNNEQRKKLRDALISAFPSEADLEIMLEDELEIKLNTIASGGNYTAIVFNIVNWFKSQGRTQDLVQAAYKVNSGNPKLKEFIREIGIANI